MRGGPESSGKDTESPLLELRWSIGTVPSGAAMTLGGAEVSPSEAVIVSAGVEVSPSGIDVSPSGRVVTGIGNEGGGMG